jgi:tricorn protease-like protein
VAFSPDGKSLYGAAGSREGLSITIWDAAAGTVAGRHRCETDSDVEALATTCGGRRLVALRPRAGILCWDVATGKERRIDTSGGRALRARSLAVAPDGRWFVTGGQDGRLVIWDAETLKEARALPAHDNAVGAVTISPDGRLVGSVGDDDWMCLWDVATGGEADRIRVDGLPTCAVMSDSRIWLGCRDSTIRAYEYKP